MATPLGLILLACTLLHAESVDFEKSVKPIFAARCQSCHKAFPPGAIKAGDPDRSPLLQAISGDKPRMSKAGDPLTPHQIAIIRSRIAEGAKGMAEDVWWSFRPLSRASGASIDSFIGAGLRAKGLSFSPEADRRTLIRRVYYDLHGLPPSPDEVEAFIHDTRPDAYELLYRPPACLPTSW